MVERRTAGPDGHLTVRNRLYLSSSANTLGAPGATAEPGNSTRICSPNTPTSPPSTAWGSYILKCPFANTVDGSTDGVVRL